MEGDDAPESFNVAESVVPSATSSNGLKNHMLCSIEPEPVTSACATSTPAALTPRPASPSTDASAPKQLCLEDVREDVRVIDFEVPVSVVMLRRRPYDAHMLFRDLKD